MPIVHPPALHALLDLARTRVRRATIVEHVLQDPGTGGYVAALAAVIDRGAAAIEASFDLVESLGPGANWGHVADDEFRWFRVLTATTALFLRGGSFILETHQLLASLLVDAIALGSGRAREPRDALLRLCREFPPLLEDPREGGLFMLGELILLGAGGEAADAELVAARCAAVERITADCAEYYLPGDDWQPNPWFASSAPAPWGWTSRSELHPVWFGLIAEHFPGAPAAARTLQQRLLAEGARWASRPRRL